ncbi:MAG: PLDc N-terminal domain-containing protein [Planctomycetaceae bacterium]|nr:PLDc N-terminal domain-containing protein [Planctomycetaceae bacterium]
MMSLLVGLMLMIIGFILMVLAFVFWLWMLVDCLKYEPSVGNDKIIWALVIILLSGFGALLYYLVRRPERIKQTGQ